VCIPKTVTQLSLFEQGIKVYHPIPEFISAVNQWEGVKGLATGKYTRRRLKEGIMLDVFIVNEINWGIQFAIRTGSKEFNQFHLIPRCKSVVTV
jgi:hypothetical protein